MANLNEISATLKTGNEALTFKGSAINYTLLDFWKWSVSDILSNATRGRFAEFIVGSAIGLDINKLRSEWGAFDLITSEGIKIEVKSSSYIQVWQQNKFSTISFSIKSTQHYEGLNENLRGGSKRQADIYVFCLLKHKEQETINPLNLEQWEFYILPTFKLDNYTRSENSITLNSLQKMTKQVEYDSLKEKIYEAYDEQVQNK